jgi:prophage DNA circulation protein
MQPASFRGIPFLVESEATSSGKKTVTHDYPNSNKRFVEELGDMPPVFNIAALIHGDLSGELRLRLEDAFRLPGLGELVHPVYGPVQVQVISFTSSTNQRRLGEVKFTVNFATSEAVVTASPRAPTEQAVSKAAEDARDVLHAALEDTYTEPTKSNSLESAADKADEIYQDVQDNLNLVVGPIQSASASFNRIATAARNTVFRTVQSGSALRNSLTSLYNTGLAISSDPAAITEAWKNLLDFNLNSDGIASDVAPTPTVQRQAIEENNSILNEHTRLMALVNLYESTAFTNYTTEDELNADEALLDSKYNAYMEQAIDVIGALNVTALAAASELRTAMAALRTLSKSNFIKKKQNVWRVVSISPGRTSIALTSFRYFGDLEEIDELTELNPSINTANFFESTIQSVTK